MTLDQAVNQRSMTEVKQFIFLKPTEHADRFLQYIVLLKAWALII